MLVRAAWCVLIDAEIENGASFHPHCSCVDKSELPGHLCKRLMDPGFGGGGFLYATRLADLVSELLHGMWFFTRQSFANGQALESEDTAIDTSQGLPSRYMVVIEPTSFNSTPDRVGADRMRSTKIPRLPMEQDQ